MLIVVYGSVKFLLLLLFLLLVCWLNEFVVVVQKKKSEVSLPLYAQEANLPPVVLEIVQ
eukprot:EC788894.1.p1 GENE.EC788894.1~~EC788894.1.p1  ORF type:complete len:59 (+),score=10.38 EC788894.1:341-517(+)